MRPWAPRSLLAAGLAPARPRSAREPRREAVVVAAVENMYAGPDESVEVVSQATLGQVVEVLETSGAFARVRTPDRYEGWLPRSAIAEYADAAAPRYARAGRVVEVTSLMANVYREPDVTTARPQDPRPPRHAARGAADGPSERWLAVRLPSGDTGYVQSRRREGRRSPRAAAPRVARRTSSPPPAASSACPTSGAG